MNLNCLPILTFPCRGKEQRCLSIAMVGIDAMLYAGIIIGLLLLGGLLRYILFPPVPRSITSLADAERLVHYHIDAANRRLRRHAWMLTFVVSHLDLEKHTVTVRIGISYGRRGYPNYLGRFQQIWENARVMLRAKEKITKAFAKRAFEAEVNTFT
jgi:hypothetical protein